MKENKELKIVSNKDLLKDFYLMPPKRIFQTNLNINPTKVRLKRIKMTSEYAYCPRYFTFLKNTFLTIEELKEIVKKLEELKEIVKKLEELNCLKEEESLEEV
jgi:hypothetical protein